MFSSKRFVKVLLYLMLLDKFEGKILFGLKPKTSSKEKRSSACKIYLRFASKKKPPIIESKKELLEYWGFQEFSRVSRGVQENEWFG